MNQNIVNSQSINQAIKQTEAKGLTVTAINVNPKDAFGINWSAFGTITVNRKDAVPRGRFSLSTQKAT